ncbi:hypothetical protein ACWGE0_42110 [Lentzea sp. NPDC054927]
MRSDGQPDAQAAELPRQLGPEVGVVGHAGAVVEMLQVVAVGHVGGAQLRLVANQQDAGAVRTEL